MKDLQMVDYQKVMSTDEASQVLVRKTFERKGKVTVQFAQRIAVPSSASSNLLVAMANGITGAGFNNATALMTFTKEAFGDLFGTKDYSQDFYKGDAPLASEVFKGNEVNIEITDSIKPNGWAAKHDPKINPGTGEVVMVEGNPVYRHTTLVAGPATHSLNPLEGRQFSTGYTPPVSVEEGVGVNAGAEVKA